MTVPRNRPFDIVGTFREIKGGQLDNIGLVTLTPLATSTVFRRAGVGVGSAVALTPMTTNAAAVQVTTWGECLSREEITIHHANAASVDRTFAYQFWGIPK